MSKEKLLLVGAGGFGRVVSELARQSYDCAFVDDGAPVGAQICGIPVVGTVADLSELRRDYARLVVVIGNNEFRAQLYRRAAALGYEFPNLIAPSAYISPYASLGWGCVVLNNALVQNGAAVGNGVLINPGVETAYRAMKKRGKLDDTYKFIAFGGDGGTYDIGFQSLSGAMERGHDMVYVCYDNEAYMNTGIQRSSSTPHFADTTTTPQGTVIPGKMQQKKNLTKIMVAHGIPYVAQTTFIGNFKDITEKAHKAIYTPGAAFLNVMAPCPRGWRYPSEKLMEVTKMAVETCVWPLYEVVEGKYILSYKPKNKLPVEEYLKMQGRFAHMFKPGNEWMIEEVQKEVDKNWEELLKLCEL